MTNDVHVTLSHPQPCKLQTDVECEALKSWSNNAKKADFCTKHRVSYEAKSL